MARNGLLRDEVDLLFNVFLFQKPEETNEFPRRHNLFRLSEIGSDAAKFHLFNQGIFLICLEFQLNFYNLPR